jgi:signal transduction histidine kinase
LLTQKINEAIGENKLVQLEENYFTKYGEDCYSLQSILPFYNENNVLENIIISGIDISEIKKIEKNILQKNEELKKINSELDNFVYSVSHDLRSPLLSVKGILALIFKTSELDDKVKNYLKMAEKSILRLDGTIQEILEYSRNSRLGLKLESFNLKEMVSAIYDDLKFSTTKQVEFNIEISCNEIIFSDKSRINTVLKNILGNAFKYLKQDNQKSVVTFYAKKVNTDLLIIVSDNGEGIADNHLSKIFDMFYRASKSSSGTGLGLYICKEIIIKLNGEIKIESKLNEGTTVYVSIPITE